MVFATCNGRASDPRDIGGVGGANVVLYLGAMVSISLEVYEAAMINGANEQQ